MDCEDSSSVIHQHYKVKCFGLWCSTKDGTLKVAILKDLSALISTFLLFFVPERNDEIHSSFEANWQQRQGASSLRSHVGQQPFISTARKIVTLQLNRKTGSAERGQPQETTQQPEVSEGLAQKNKKTIATSFLRYRTSQQWTSVVTSQPPQQVSHTSQSRKRAAPTDVIRCRNESCE